MTKEFYVHTEDLKTVATKIETLLGQISNDDATPGTYTQFSSVPSIDGPTKTFWDGPNALAKAYADQHRYVDDTYKALIKQLGYVMNACTQTAAHYDRHETDAKHDVTSTTPELNR